MRISDWSSDVCSSDLGEVRHRHTAQGFAHESAWARGQAWAVYGYALCYSATGDKRYLAQAQHIADYILNHPNLPADLIPYWDFNDPKIPDTYRDASAGAIIASARSAERRVGNECVSTCRSRWSPYT